MWCESQAARCLAHSLVDRVPEALGDLPQMVLAVTASFEDNMNENDPDGVDAWCQLWEDHQHTWMDLEQFRVGTYVASNGSQDDIRVNVQTAFVKMVAAVQHKLSMLEQTIKKKKEAEIREAQRREKKAFR